MGTGGYALSPRSVDHVEDGQNSVQGRIDRVQAKKPKNAVKSKKKKKKRMNSSSPQGAKQRNPLQALSPRRLVELATSPRTMLSPRGVSAMGGYATVSEAPPTDASELDVVFQRRRQRDERVI